jgi:Nucleotidyltransferase domain
MPLGYHMSPTDVPAPVNERTGDLPEVVARVLDQTVEAAARALGDGLLSIVLFGSAAENRLRPTSDVNLLILVNRFDPARVDTLRPTLQQGRAAIRLAVMWLTQDELPAAGESFSVKFADIVRRHRVLYGNDPFEHFAVSRRAAIARVQQVLFNLVLRLRASYALESDREERLAYLIADAAGPLRASAAEILDLQGTPASNGRAALELLARQWSPTKAPMVIVSISQARETRRLEPADTARVYLEVIDLAGHLRRQAAALS